jgi:hypothetical protein
MMPSLGTRALATRALAMLLLASTLLTGCMGWSPAAVPAPRIAPTDTVAAPATPHRARVWARGRAYDVYEAVWQGDSLRGRDADGHPVRLARGEIDSVRVRRLRPGATFLATTGAVVGTGLALVGIVVAVCVDRGCD